MLNDQNQGRPKNTAKKELRRGWTTGACAAAGAGAAYHALINGDFPKKATIRLPGGQSPVFDLSTAELGDGYAMAGIIKDAGDDPDVTHGLEIIVKVARGPQGSGICFAAGTGVGTVTLPGLPLSVGEPSINPGPRAMISQAIKNGQTNTPDVLVTVCVPGGEDVAKKTMNARLGIKGGISILGTSGIVIPYSCASWIHAIRQGIDVANELGLEHLLAATGRTSESAANEILQLPEQALIDMGDFVGGMLKYLASKKIKRITIAGGFGKISKLAQGEMDLHSSRSSVDVGKLAAKLEQLGADKKITDDAGACTTAAQVLQLAGDMTGPLANMVARQAREVVMATLAGGTEVEVWIFDRSKNRIATSKAVQE